MPGMWGEGTYDCHLPQAQVLKCLDRALKERYKPKEEKKDKEGKPKRHLRVSATKEGSEEDSGPSAAEEEGDDCWIPTRHGPVALP
jgi:hypothetical protein